MEVTAVGHDREVRWIELVAGEDRQISVRLKQEPREDPGVDSSPHGKPLVLDQPDQLGAAPKSKLLRRLGMEFVKIPAGTFLMGTPAYVPGKHGDETQHRVTIAKPFLMGKHEVTQGQWEKVMGTWIARGDNPSQFRECGDNCPVEYLNWLDTVIFCNRLSKKEGLRPAYRIKKGKVTWNRSANGYRLPTEAEWEYAARSGKETAADTGPTRSFGRSGALALDEIAWYSMNSRENLGSSHRSAKSTSEQYESGKSGTHPVGQKAPNAWGLHDMIGNVWEWCWDWYGQYSSLPVTDPEGAETGSRRVFRGGSWYNNARDCRATLRLDKSPDYRSRNLGFRVCRAAE